MNVPIVLDQTVLNRFIGGEMEIKSKSCCYRGDIEVITLSDCNSSQKTGSHIQVILSMMARKDMSEDKIHHRFIPYSLKKQYKTTFEVKKVMSGESGKVIAFKDAEGEDVLLFLETSTKVDRANLSEPELCLQK